MINTQPAMKPYSKYTYSEIDYIVADCVMRRLAQDIPVPKDALLSNYGDSIDIVQIVSDLEEEFDIQFTETECAGVMTCRNLTDIIARHTGVINQPLPYDKIAQFARAKSNMYFVPKYKPNQK